MRGVSCVLKSIVNDLLGIQRGVNSRTQHFEKGRQQELGVV